MDEHFSNVSAEAFALDLRTVYADCPQKLLEEPHLEFLGIVEVLQYESDVIWRPVRRALPFSRLHVVARDNVHLDPFVHRCFRVGMLGVLLAVRVAPHNLPPNLEAHSLESLLIRLWCYLDEYIDI